MSLRPPREPVTLEEFPAVLVRHAGGIPTTDKPPTRRVRAMVVGGAYEVALDHPHCRAVLELVEKMHVESANCDHAVPVSMKQAEIDGFIYRVTASRPRANAWTWSFVSVDSHGMESSVEFKHEHEA